MATDMSVTDQKIRAAYEAYLAYAAQKKWSLREHYARDVLPRIPEGDLRILTKKALLSCSFLSDDSLIAFLGSMAARENTPAWASEISKILLGQGSWLKIMTGISEIQHQPEYYFLLHQVLALFLDHPVLGSKRPVDYTFPDIWTMMAEY